MSDTAITPLPTNGDSKIFGSSIRGWLALLSVMGVVGTHFSVTVATLIHAVRSGDFALVGTLTTIGEPFYSLAIGAVAYYFGAAKAK